MADSDPKVTGVDIATENVELEDLELVHNHLELRIIQEGQREFRFPFFASEMRLAEIAPTVFSADSQWLVHLEEEIAVLSCPSTGQKHSLASGENLEIEGVRLWLIDVRKPPLAELEGVTPPFVGRVWHIKSHQSWVGRSGKRLNHVELNDPTISRTHATLIPDPNGCVSLLSESPASPTTVNGQRLSAGESLPLSHGDLLGFGKLLFRFASKGNTPTEGIRLFVNSLVHFRLAVGSENGQAIEIKSEKARHLFCLLATQWGEPLAVEPVIERFWPGVPATRGRKNLSYILGQLKEVFKELDLEFSELLLRTPATLTLEPRFLGAHDYLEVRKLVSGGKAVTSPSGVRRLLRLHTGPFLTVCYEDWAESLRKNLQQDVMTTLVASAEHHLQTGEAETCLLAANGALELDETHEKAALCVMQAHIHRTSPEEAVKFYERFERVLNHNSLEPSMELVKLFHRARLGI